MENRILVIGDIHGCYDELIELIRKVAYNPYQDRLIFLGDFLDKGPKSLDCIRKARELGAESVLSNHEMKYLRYRHHELKKQGNRHYRNPMNFDEKRYAIYRGLTDADWAYIKQMPSYIKVNDGTKDVFIVHAGFEPYKPIETQHPKTMAMIRFVNDKGDMAGNIFKAVPGVYPWATKWCRTENVIYGHQVWGLETPRIDINEVGGRCLGIDTGACYGGHLTCLVLPSYEIVQVKSHSVYADLKYAAE